MPVTCPYCQTHFPNSDSINARHKAVCSGWQAQLGDTAPRVCLCGHEATSLTQMKRHRSVCEVWKSRHRGTVQMARMAETLQAKHGEGITHPRLIEEAEERRKATIKERYGAENVFSKESIIFEKVQESLVGKRTIFYGKDNTFSKPETQEKIRRTNLAKYGVENPNQSPEIRAKTQSTNLQRYGSEEILAAPVIRQKIAETNQEKYGGPAPSCSEEVVEKARQTNLERWGVEWTNQDPDVRRRQLETTFEHYGTYYFASEQGKSEIRAVLIEKYGVDHPAKIDGFWEKTVATFIRKYGATHPLLLAEFLEKREHTCLERYGVEHPLQSPEIYAKLVETVKANYGVEYVLQAESVKEKVRQTTLDRYGVPYAIQAESVKEKVRQTNTANYGVPYPMMNREYAFAHLQKMSRPGPNLFEHRFASLNPELLYVGNGVYWRWLPKVRHHKNPDFILPGPDKDHPKREVGKVVEVFGDFWHSRMFTGKVPFEHEQELIEAYRDIGLDCLIIWEGEVKKDPQAVRARVLAFLK